MGSHKSLPKGRYHAEETRAAGARRGLEPRGKPWRGQRLVSYAFLTRPGCLGRSPSAPNPKLQLPTPLPTGQRLPRGSSCEGLVVALAAMAAPEVACVHRRLNQRASAPPPRLPRAGQARPIGGRACDRAAARAPRAVPSSPRSEILGKFAGH